MMTSSLPVHVILDILRRRLWIAVAVVTLAASGAAGLALFLPNTYSSNAVIVVEGQQIPEQMVRPTVTSGTDTRVQRISQEILSRSRLERIIKEFNLYPDLQKGNVIDDVITSMRRDIRVGIDTGAAGRRGRRPGRSSGLSFGVSYTGPDARKVMLVANTLASFFIEENLKARERQASGTADFLQVQLQETKKRLEQQEGQVAEFKERNMGELPQQVEANLKTLDRLEAQRKDLTDAVLRARERRAQAVRQMETEPQGGGDMPVAVRPDPQAARIAGLQRQLAELRLRFSDKYPDVVQLKVELARLEDEQRKTVEATGEAKPATTAKATPVLGALRPESMLAPIDAEIRRATDELDRLQREVDKYQRRVENAPRREQELTGLTRDYNSTKDLYNSLLKRQEEASIAESMEQRQKGEQFRILDPAVMPDSPTGPPRLLIFVGGIALGLALAAGIILLAEVLDGSFHNVEDLKGFARVPVLVTIPKIVTETDLRKGRMGQLVRAGILAVSLVAIFGSSYVVAKDNEQLVRTLTRGPMLKK